jgi:cysteine desulfurase
MSHDIYMDYNATAPARPEVIDVYQRVATECFGNASSSHFAGRRAKAVLDDARAAIAATLGARPSDVVFTSGGTESDNLAIIGVARAKGSGHVITTRTEHPAVLEACRWLEANGFEVDYLPVDTDGLIDPGAVREALRDDTVLVTIMWTNNETGVVQPIDAIGAVVREHGALFHSDAVQAFGRAPIDVARAGVDLLSLSAHKFCGPKGVGALIAPRGIALAPVMHGGGQESNRRSGTYNVPGAAAMAEAARIAHAEMDGERERQGALRGRLEAGILERIPDSRVNAAAAPRVANTSNVHFDGADGEAVLVALDGLGIAASSASACAASSAGPSYALMAMGLTRREAEDSMRFSLGRFSTEADVDNLLEVLPGVIQHVRSLGRSS